MKKIFALLISLQLILIPLGAHAESRGTGVYVKAVSSLALGSTGSVALTACNFAWSTTLFSVASLAMIAADIATAKKYTEYQKKKKEELKVKLENFKTANGDIQKEAVLQQLEMEKEQLKNIKSRETIHYAIGTALIAATALAVLEGIQAYGPVPNPLYIPNGGCNNSSNLKFLGIGVSKTVQMAWGAAAAASGATSAAGTLFSILQMALTLGVGTISGMMSSMFNNGFSRAAFFGVNSGLVFWVAGDLSNRRKVVNDNIDQLEKLKGDFDKMKTDGGLAENGEGGDSTRENFNYEPPKSAIKTLPKVAAPNNCFNMGSNNATPSLSAENCNKPLKLKPVKFPANFNIPALQQVASQMTTAVNDLATGNWERAEVSFAGVGAQAARMKDILKQAEAQYNEKLKAEGKAPVDLQKDVNKQVAALEKEIGGFLGANAAELAAVPNHGTDSKADEEKNQQEITKVESAEPTATPQNPFHLYGETETEEMPEQKVATLSESLDEFESSESDIAKDPGVSIFRQVSNRYLLNYTKIFNRKEIAPPMQEASKTP